MPLGTDFLLDASGDLDMTNGDITQAPSIVQAIQKKLRLIKGEWFADTSAGVPYYEEVWIKNPVPEHLEQIFKDAILSVEGVNSVVSLDLDYDNETRTLTVTFEADTVDGAAASEVLL
jgi:hypothetical protein